MSVTLTPTHTPAVATTVDAVESHGSVNVTLFDGTGQPLAWSPMHIDDARHLLVQLAGIIGSHDSHIDSALADWRAEQALEAAAVTARAQHDSETWV